MEIFREITFYQTLFQLRMYRDSLSIWACAVFVNTSSNILLLCTIVEGLKKHSNEATCKAERQKVYETALTAL